MSQSGTDEKNAVKLGFIGLGLMGGPMSGNLVDAGYDVAVWNRDSAKSATLRDKGAAVAADPAALARDCDVVFLCLTDTAAVEAVVFGPCGLSEGARDGMTICDFSTISPDAAREYGERMKAQCGAGWIDAPVSGGRGGAQSGKLISFVGGDAADVERVRPYMAPMCQRFEHVGAAGAGLVVKLCNQLVVGCVRPVLAELVTFARDAGVDPAELPKLFAGGAADSWLLQMDVPMMAARDFSPRSTAATFLTDLDLLDELAEAQGTPVPMAALARQLWRLLVAKGHGGDNATALVTLYDRENA